MISKKDLQNTIDFWDANCNNIMESQREYNKIAEKWSRERLEKWMQELQ